LEELDLNTVNNYDCAAEFDKFASLYKNNKYWYGHMFYFDSITVSDRKIFDFLDNRCYTTYKSWMDKSNQEYFITELSPYFENYSYMEQMFNNEISCEIDSPKICDLKKTFEMQFKEWDLYCKDIDKTSTNREINNCWINYVTALEKYET